MFGIFQNKSMSGIEKSRSGFLEQEMMNTLTLPLPLSSILFITGTGPITGRAFTFWNRYSLWWRRNFQALWFREVNSNNIPINLPLR